MADVRFAEPTLATLDALRVEMLVAHAYLDERPLRGVLDLVDWRLGAAVSRGLRSGAITGGFLERVLMPPAGALPCEKILIVGGGERGRMSRARAVEMLSAIEETARDVGTHAVAWQPPEWDEGVAERSESIVSALLALPRGAIAEVTVLETSGNARAMRAVVEREQRRARAARDG